MNRFEALRANRRRRRKVALQSARDAIHAELEAHDIEYRLFGSFVRDDVRDHSDLDIMILGDLTVAQRAAVRRLAAAAGDRAGIEVDLLFEADLTPRGVEALLGR